MDSQNKKFEVHAYYPDANHVCGGTILSGPDHDYCDRCRAFAYDGDDVPSGTAEAANREAWDRGDDQSPD